MIRFVNNRSAEAAQEEKEADDPNPAPTGSEARAVKCTEGGLSVSEPALGLGHRDMYRYRKVSAALRPVGLACDEEAEDDIIRESMASRSLPSNSSA